jgi:protein-tyrosine phosphatase
MLRVMPRDLDWEGCVNVRDLGGFPTPGGATAFGVFVRADNARKLTAAGWDAAAKYGIRTILDLRSEPECAADPPAHGDFTHTRLSLFDHFDGDEAYRADLMARVAHLDVAERHRVLYCEALERDAVRFGQAFGVLAEADGGVLFHCVGGKDRTGMLTALLLRLAGVDVEAVEADYVRSEERLASAPDREPGLNVTPRGVIDHAVAEIEARHGSTVEYLLRAGVTAEQLDRIRARLAPDSRTVPDQRNGAGEGAASIHLGSGDGGD